MSLDEIRRKMVENPGLFWLNVTKQVGFDLILWTVVSIYNVWVISSYICRVIKSVLFGKKESENVKEDVNGKKDAIQ